MHKKSRKDAVASVTAVVMTDRRLQQKPEIDLCAKLPQARKLSAVQCEISNVGFEIGFCPISDLPR
jgi:hypothetical protein